jgi:hypothetical protein
MKNSEVTIASGALYEADSAETEVVAVGDVLGAAIAMA